MIKDIIKVATSPSPGVISIIASAGAGKTFTLTSVYMALLLRGAYPSEILGITFTNKAAEEMRERVLCRFMKIVFDGDSKELELFSEALSLSHTEVRERARRVLEDVLFDFSSFSLQTIDSFLNRLRLAFSFELKISPGAELRPSVYTDAELIVSRMLERAKAESSIKEAIFRFVNYYSEALSVYRSWDPLFYAQRMFPTYLVKQSHYAKPLCVNSQSRFNLATIRRVLAQRDRFLSVCQELGVKPIKNVMALLDSFTSRSLFVPKDIVSSYLSSDYLRREQFPKIIKGGAKLGGREISILLSAWQDLIEEFYNMELEFSRSFAWPFLHIYSSIFQELDRFQHENDIAYLSLLQLYISKLDPVLVAEKSTARYGRYKYFLIDEFQDTSLSQWKALYPILEEALSSGGMLLCVGDPKQTIYRWRGSEPDMFSKLASSFATQHHQFVLLDNWRSAPEIVYFNNRLFSRFPELAMKQDLDIDRVDEEIWQEIKRNYSPVQAMQRPQKEYSGDVEVIPVEVEDVQNTEELKERVLSALIDHIEQGVEEDRCILVRRRSEARDIITTLARRGISAVSDESLSLVCHPVIMAIVSLLRYLAFPEEAMYLRLFFLSEFWARYSGKGRDFWEMELRLKKDDQLIKYVKDLFQGIRASSLFLMISNLIRRLRVKDLYPTQGIFVDGFLEVVWRWESENGASLRGFLDYWTRQEESPLEAERLNLPISRDSVKVMTIHGSKGLEFNEVLLPFLDLRPGESRARGLEGNLYWELTDEIDMYYITKPMAGRHPKLREIYNREYTLRIWDDINLLYVAMTRAKRHLTLFLTRPNKGRFSWQSLVESNMEVSDSDSYS